MTFNPEQLSARIWKVVEADRHGQYPFLYVIMGADKCILIDTGCGTGADYRAWVGANINRSNLPYLVICTHVHFDHTGGNFRFSGANSAGCLGIYMGGADQTFSKNCSINSLCMAHNATIRDFQVTRELIYLDDANPSKEQALEVIFTPGHTTDSIALYYPAEKKLFVGDTLYLATLDKLIAFIDKQKAVIASAPAEPASPAPVVAAPPADPLAGLIADFLAFTGLSESDLKQFSVHSLFELCDKNLERAVDMYLTSPADVRAMCPANANTGGPAASKPVPSASSTSGIVLCCGHVEAALAPDALQTMQGVMGAIRAKAVSPVHIDDGYGEYSVGNFTIMVSLKAKWE